MFRPLLSPARIRQHEAAGVWPVPGMSELLRQRIQTAPQALFIVDGDVRLTFGDFARRIERLAAGLTAMGMRAGDVISWQLPSWWEAAALAVAIDHIGAIS